MNEYEILPLAEEHLDGVAEIERLCFSEPWSRNALTLLLGEGGFGVVALLDGQVAAYGGMTFVLDEGSVTNIATHPDFRRKGLGRAVTAKMLEEAFSRGLETVFLEVRESNVAARALYEGLCFETCGIRKNFYRKPTESALQMIRRAETFVGGKKDRE